MRVGDRWMFGTALAAIGASAFVACGIDHEASNSENLVARETDPGIVRPSSCPAEQMRCEVAVEAPVSAQRAELRGDWAAGTWNNGVAMTHAGSSWQATVQVPPGQSLEYKVCLDATNGRCRTWWTDPSRPTLPPYGNNVVRNVSCANPICVEAPTAPVQETVTRFVALGDTGKGSSDQTRVGNAIADRCQASGCDFVLLLGDNIYNDGATSPTDAQFRDKFELPYARVNAPFYAVLGNHDYGGNGSGNDWNRAQNEIEYSNRSSKWHMPSRRYHFTKNDVEIFATDTNAQMYDWDLQQKGEVQEWLSESTARWKVVIGHHPYISNGPHGTAGSYENGSRDPVFSGARVKRFAEEVWCGKADVYLSGHDHSRQYLTETCGGTELAVSGAGAAPTSLPGHHPTRFQSTELGFLYVTVSAHTMTMEFWNASGQKQFTRTLTK